MIARILIACLLASAATAASAPAVTEVWARATVPGQEAGAIFAIIVGAHHDDRLIAADSPAATTVEVHEHIAAPDGVMQMREVIGGIPVPARARVVLKPRSYHIMLIGLKQPLTKGSSIPVGLVFEHAGRQPCEAIVLDPWAMAYDDR